MFRKILLTIILFNALFLSFYNSANAERECMSLGPSDNNTFKEYCYKITDVYLAFRNKFKVDGEIDTYLAGKILNYSKQGLNYLPDDLLNKNYYTHLQSAIERGIKDPKNSLNFDTISSSINDFLNLTKIEEINGTIDVFPASGNAPLSVTFRGNVSDPTGSKLYGYNYTWWILDGGKRKNIGTGNSLNYTFREEGNFTVFLDVTSNHRNSLRNTDVIPFSKKVTVSVREKAASLILKVNNKGLDFSDELKFSPEESVYGLLFDATSSTPTSGTKFLSTEWNFGNGVVRKNNGAPRIERVVYANEGEYKVSLKLVTNTGKAVERNFSIIIRNPIASINASATEGFLGDKFNFTANNYSRNENINYFWEIVDLKNDKIIFSKNLSTLSYTFQEKGRYNVKLIATSASGEKDYDNKIIYINSRTPIANFVSTIPNSNKPNTVFLDATSSYDLDFSDDGKLEYSWIINGDRVNLDNPSFNGSNGYFTFENIGEQSISLEVRDPDDLVGLKTNKIVINSNLSVDFFAFPRVSQAGGIMRFTADSPKAKFYEWDFGDGTIVGGKDDNISHKYKKSGIYTVRLSVRDENDLKNSIEKVVYVGDADQPYANIKINGNSYGEGEYGYKEGVCNGKGAYIINKVDNVTLSGIDSIDVTGTNTGLNYSWKIGDKFYSTKDISKRFDDIGCIPVKLTVKSQKNGKEAFTETYLKVENLKPELTGLDIQVKDLNSDPVIVDVKALGAIDKDGVIQSYLWYYYTDVSSEPQDFRATRGPSTTFVLPKITGTYYFVAVLKDNNEDRTLSSDLESKYFVTLTGDNVNTPIIGLSANNTSIKSGEEVVFTAEITNILGQNLNNSVKYSWDFDGDGFYDLETNKNVVSYKFKKSGEYRVKLKVKNKGFSNTKNIVVNVSNILKPNFDFISIGSDLIIFDKSEGSIESYSWDMGDGQIIDKKGSFSYKYKDGKSTHIVKLTIVDGSTKKDLSKKVINDYSKLISSKKESLSIFSNYALNNNKISINEEISSLQIFLKTNLGNISNYAVDFNIENDSDLNGGKDDDEDNKNTTGYTTGGPVDIALTDKRLQKIKIFLKDSNGKVIETKEITLDKEYIKQELADISNKEIKLDGVPESVKKSFNKIKEEVNLLDSDNKLKALSYLQRLQEEWADIRERTNIVIEFSNFIADLNLANGQEILSLLEGMIVDENEKNSEKTSFLRVLKNMIPKDISCPADFGKEAENKKISCYDLLVSKLDLIAENTDITENKAIGKEILSVVAVDKTMTKKQKEDFKAFLVKVINNGTEPTKEDLEGTKSNDSGSENADSSGIMGNILKIMLIILVIVLGIFLIGFLIYFLTYKLKGNKDDQSFRDYVADQTGNNLEKEDILAFGNSSKENESFDPLKDEVEIKGTQEKNDGDIPSWLKGAEQKVGNNDENFNQKVQEVQEKSLEKLEENNIEEIEEEKEQEKSEGEVPDWLKISGEETEKLEENNVEEIEEEKEQEKSEGEVPDWLKTSGEETEKLEENNIEEIEEEKEQEKSEGEVPDWLKTSEEETEKHEENNVEEIEPKLETKEELDEFTKIKNEPEEENQDDGIPDWLKGTFGESNNLSTIEDRKEENLEKTEEEKTTKKRKPRTKKTSDKTKTDQKQDDQKSYENEEQLWEDGMKVPDWLKSDE